MEPKEELEKMEKDITTALDTFQNYPPKEKLQKWLKEAQEGK